MATMRRGKGGSREARGWRGRGRIRLRLACLGLLLFTTACATIDLETLRACEAAFSTAHDIAAATLVEAEAAAAREGLEVATDLQLRRQVLDLVRAYHTALLGLAEGGDAARAAADTARLAEVLGKLAGAALTPIAGEVAALSQPIGLIVARVDELLARERYGDVVRTAGPLVEELLALLAADGPALHTLIAAPLWELQASRLDDLTRLSFAAQRLAAGQSEVEGVPALLARLNQARLEAPLPPGVSPLPPLTATGAGAAGEVDLQRLADLVSQAENAAAALQQGADALAAHRELTHRYESTLLAAAEAMRSLRLGLDDAAEDPEAALETLAEHVRWFREAYQAYQEARS